MNEVDVESQVKQLLEPVLAGQGSVVEDVSYRPRQNPPVLIVTIDRLEGTDSLSLDEIGTVAQLVSEVLDEADPIDSEYTLEVSTPGAESKLTRLRHFQRNIGRTVQVKFKDGQQTLGILESATETGFNVVQDGKSRYVDYDETKWVRPRVQFG